MIESFPVEFTLESGTNVTVDKMAADTYHFSLKAAKKNATDFTYVEDGRPKSAWDDTLDFQQLEALRTFWLMNEDVV